MATNSDFAMCLWILTVTRQRLRRQTQEEAQQRHPGKPSDQPTARDETAPASGSEKHEEEKEPLPTTMLLKIFALSRQCREPVSCRCDPSKCGAVNGPESLTTDFMQTLSVCSCTNREIGCFARTSILADPSKLFVRAPSHEFLSTEASFPSLNDLVRQNMGTRRSAEFWYCDTASVSDIVDALVARGFEDCKRLVFGNCSLTERTLVASQLLRRAAAHLSSLTLESVDLDDKCLFALCECAVANLGGVLRTLSVKGNSRLSGNALLALCKAVVKGRHVTALNMSLMQLKDADVATVIAPTLSSAAQLESLDLSSNELTRGSLPFVAQHLTQLCTIDLGGHDFNAEDANKSGATAVAFLVHSCAELTRLSLAGCNLHEEGVHQLMCAVRRRASVASSASLTSVDLSSNALYGTSVRHVVNAWCEKHAKPTSKAPRRHANNSQPAAALQRPDPQQFTIALLLNIKSEFNGSPTCWSCCHKCGKGNRKIPRAFQN